MINSTFWIKSPERSDIWYYILNTDPVITLEKFDDGFEFRACIETPRRMYFKCGNLQDAQAKALSLYKRLLTMQFNKHREGAQKCKCTLDALNS